MLTKKVLRDLLEMAYFHAWSLDGSFELRDKWRGLYSLFKDRVGTFAYTATGEFKWFDQRKDWISDYNNPLIADLSKCRTDNEIRQAVNAKLNGRYAFEICRYCGSYQTMEAEIIDRCHECVNLTIVPADVQCIDL